MTRPVPRPPRGPGGPDRSRRFRWLERFGLRFTLTLAVGVGLGVPVALLALLVVRRFGPLLRLDVAVDRRVHTLALSSTPLVDTARAMTFLGSTAWRAAVVLAVGGYLLRRRVPRSAAYLAAAVVGGGLLDGLLKVVVRRSRPALPNPLAHAGGASFPSGHAFGATVLYGALLVLALPGLRAGRRTLVVALVSVLVALIGASRVVLGVHYPSDVVAGWLLGLAWLVGTTAAFRRGAERPGRDATVPARREGSQS